MDIKLRFRFTLSGWHALCLHKHINFSACQINKLQALEEVGPSGRSETRAESRGSTKKQESQGGSRGKDEKSAGQRQRQEQEKAQ